MKLKLMITAIWLLPIFSKAQLGDNKNKYTKADTLRGSLNENRDWWDVLRYDIEVKPDYESKSIQGSVNIRYDFTKKLSKEMIREVVDGKRKLVMQLDLQQPLIIDSIISVGYDGSTIGLIVSNQTKTNFTRKGNIALIELTNLSQVSNSVFIYYHGLPKEAKKAPWDGGWIWAKDSLGRPWMSVAVQGLGASAWYPCKDHQSDEPDEGASLTIIVPDTLVAVANGRMRSKLKIENSKWHAYTWEVKSPINNYNIVPYIGKYVNWGDTYQFENTPEDVYRVNEDFDSTVLDTFHAKRSSFLSFWVLDYNLQKARQQFQQVKPMLRCFEYWFGPYPFYEDGYKLVDAPHLGMEHQSAVAYGNKYRNGYLGRDLSGTGWGLKWDFIIIHESGHEWFGNNITTKDIADMWVHESFTCYSETLYTEWMFGKQAGDEYNYGIRKNISNDIPIIGHYGVNEEGSGDMYYKGANMINIIRKAINNDSLFRNILRGLNETFRHKTVTTAEIENYISKTSGIDFQKTFDQYLRTVQVPQLEYYFSKDKTVVYYRWTNCVKGFNLPLVINNKRYNISTRLSSSKISAVGEWNADSLVKKYYITAKEVSSL